MVMINSSMDQSGLWTLGGMSESVRMGDAEEDFCLFRLKKEVVDKLLGLVAQMGGLDRTAPLKSLLLKSCGVMQCLFL